MEENRKIKVHIVGASHAAKLATAIYANVDFCRKFEISHNTQPGANIDSFRCDFQKLVSLDEEDFVIVNLLGNDLLQKHIHITRSPRKIHLTRFEPKSDLAETYSKLREILSCTRARILILDHIYKNINCCSEHQYPELPGFWVRKNRELVIEFRQYAVYDHRKLLPYTWDKVKDMSFYSTLFIDGVHLHPLYYVGFASQFLRIVTHMSLP